MSYEKWGVFPPQRIMTEGLMNPGHLSKDLIKEKGSDFVTILGNKDWGEEMARAKAPKRHCLCPSNKTRRLVQVGPGE